MIKQLDAALVQRIAAGEVIDRPSSIIRELLDNSLDAGSSSITIWIEGGGIDSITVQDNGSGMSEEDLRSACHAHATSKISTIDDLFRIRTMGFRGEALYSIAACSAITIVSRGKKKTVDNTSEGPVQDDLSSESGTRIEVKDLFSQIPARKMFLKRPATEAAMCMNMAVEKALAFPSVEFKLFSDQELKVHLPSAEPRQRVIDVLSRDHGFLGSDTDEFLSDSDTFKLYGVGTTSESYRSDRSQIKVFVNSHCIEDFSLVTAITNGYSEQFPGGRFPYFCLFITIDPELVDFNIHPAKRECRIRIKAQLSGWVTTMIRSQLRKKIRQVTSQPRHEEQPFLPDQNSSTAEASPSYGGQHGIVQHQGFERSDLKFDQSWFENARKVMKKTEPPSQFEEIAKRLYIYVGQVFRLFLVAEKDGKLMFVDQHAAHERILYDEFCNNKQIQRLLIPYRFEVERDTDAFLLENSYIYSDFGIELTRPEDLIWEIDTIPLISKGVEDRIASFIKDSTGDIEEIEKNLFSTLACKAAIKAGDEVDSLTAIAILDKVLKMEKPVCPHGRIFITEITEQSLREAVGRFK